MADFLKVFIDTEFTDFKDCDLISLGMVAETGQEFYLENAEYEKKWASQFVRQHVLPLCNFQKSGVKRLTLAARAWEWLEELPCDNVQIMIDYKGDWELLIELLSEPHPKLKSPPMNLYVPLHTRLANARTAESLQSEPSDKEYTKIAEQAKVAYTTEFYNYFLKTKEIQHHALSDAKANLRGFNAMMLQVERGLSA